MDGLGSLQCISVPSKLDYDILQALHPKTLISICCKGPQAAHFHSAMQQVTALGDNDMPIHHKMLLAHEQKMKLFGTGSLYTGRGYIIPTQKLLNRLDPMGEAVYETLHRELRRVQTNYEKLVPNPTPEAQSWDLHNLGYYGEFSYLGGLQKKRDVGFT